MLLRNKNRAAVRQLIDHLGRGTGILESIDGDVMAAAAGESLRLYSSAKRAEHDALKDRQFYVRADGVMNGGTVYMPNGAHVVIPTQEVGEANVVVEIPYPLFSTATLVIGGGFATEVSHRIWAAEMMPQEVQYYTSAQAIGTYHSVPAPAGSTIALVSPTGYGRRATTLRFPIRYDGVQRHVGSLFPHYNFEQLP